MRVLFVCVPQTGHITPLLPLAQAFRDQDDEVMVASGADAQPLIDAAALRFCQVGPPFGDWFAALQARTRGIPGDGLAPDRIEKYFVPRLFGEIGAAAMLDELLRLARSFRPELVVFDPVSFAAPLVGALTGSATLHHTLGPLLHPEVLELVADVMSPMWRQFGLDVPRAAGLYSGTTVTICPPSLDPAGQKLADAQPMRPVQLPDETPPVRPIRLPIPDAPLIYLTLGTFSNSLDLFRLIIDALADQPLNLVATIGVDKDPSELGAIPFNTQVERFIAQHALLPHCSAVIHHGGAGTALGVLAHGLPSVALPQSADNFTIARRLADSNVSLILMPDEVAPDRVRAALTTVLQDTQHETASLRIAAEIATMPDPREVAGSMRRRRVSSRS